MEVSGGYRYRRFARIDPRRSPTLGTAVDDTRRVDEEYFTDVRAGLKRDLEVGIVALHASRREGRPTIVPSTAVSAADALENRFRVSGFSDLILRLSWQRVRSIAPLENLAVDLEVKLDTAGGDRELFSDLALGTGQTDVAVAVRGKKELDWATLAGGVKAVWRGTATVSDLTGARVRMDPGDELLCWLDVLRAGPASWWVASLSLCALISAIPGTDGLLDPVEARRFVALSPGFSVHLTESVELAGTYRMPLLSRNVTRDGQGYEISTRFRF
ncbi:MAG: hypothetical protein HY815_25270 [Candidatus Riflebacteria bacterium]|nr:hypothetical protein [Candidatus Riflebacteria bacterium]